MSGTSVTLHVPAKTQPDSRSVDASDHKSAVTFLLELLEDQHYLELVRAVGHRVVHGMHHTEPELVTQAPAWPPCAMARASTPAWASLRRRDW